MVVAAVAAAVVLGVGVGIAAAAGGGGGGVVEAAAAAEVVIESDFHIGICCGVTGFGYGTGMDRGMDRDTLSGPAFTLWLWRKRASLLLHVPGKAETEGVVIIAPLEVQEAPSGTRTGLTSLQAALAILVVATQLVSCICPTTRSTRRKWTSTSSESRTSRSSSRRDSSSSSSWEEDD